MYCCRNSLGDNFFPDTGESNVEWWFKEENEDSVGSSRVVVVQRPGHCERTLALATRTSSPNVESMSAWTKVARVVEGVVIALQGGAVNYAITLVRQVKVVTLN